MKLEGADKLLKSVPGGLDGVYALASCENGRPLYKRQDSLAGRAHPALTHLYPNVSSEAQNVVLFRVFLLCLMLIHCVRVCYILLCCA